MIALRAAAALFVGTALAALGCGCSSAGGSSTASCDPAPPKAVAVIRRAARSDFVLGDNKVARVEVGKAASVVLPASARSFGVDRIVAVLVNSTFADKGGIEGPEMFVTDAAASVVYPVGGNTAQMFDLPQPAGADWKRWEARTYRADQSYQAYDCVKPS